jgi:hypothetical protein
MLLEPLEAPAAGWILKQVQDDDGGSGGGGLAKKKGRRSATPLLQIYADQNAAVSVKTAVLPAICEPFFDEEKFGCR